MPAKIIEVADIPRTLSGKITELAVREVIHGRPVKNTDALANPQALELFRNLPELDYGLNVTRAHPISSSSIASNCRSAAFARIRRRKQRSMRWTICASD